MSTIRDPEYQARVQVEIEHYTKAFDEPKARETLMQVIPASWVNMEERASQRITRENGGRNTFDEVVEFVRANGGGRLLSLGSGPGGQELEIARRLAEAGVNYEFVCMDLNPHLTELGQQRADAEGLRFRFIVTDLNDIHLGSDEYDVIIAFASLHHLINLEQVLFEVNKALKPSGELVTVDICTRNRYFMWPETFEMVKSIWAILPDRYKYNHTSFSTPQIDRIFENRDYGADGMECSRSQEIIPLLNQYMVRKVFVSYFSLSRRFFDTMYGPNYDLTNRLDVSIMDMIWNLDVYYLDTGVLKPETFFGVYTKGAMGLRPPKYQEAPQIVPPDEPLSAPAIMSILAPPLVQGVPMLNESEQSEFRHFLHVYRRLRSGKFARLLRVANRILR